MIFEAFVMVPYEYLSKTSECDHTRARFRSVLDTELRPIPAACHPRSRNQPADIVAIKLPPAKVVFACVENAGRSQMAAAIFNRLANPRRAQAVSAGTHPKGAVHPEVVAVMLELDIDLSNARPQYLTTDLANDAHILITMGCRDQCPLVPGVERDEWPLDDPCEKPIETVRQIRDDIRKRVAALIRERRWA